jgi:hypothetical protein
MTVTAHAPARLTPETPAGPDPMGLLSALSLLRQATDDVRLYCVTPGMPAARKVDAILLLLNEVLPAPQGSPARPGWIQPGTDAAGVASLIAQRLAGHPQMATAAIEEYAGEAVIVRTEQAGELALGDDPVNHPVPGLLDGTERRRLGVPRGTACQWRTGWMITVSGVVAARVKLLAVPGRLPATVAARLHGSAPFGQLVAVHDPHRRAREARADGERVISTAAVVLGRDGAPCALAWEETLPEFTRHLARRAARE